MNGMQIGDEGGDCQRLGLDLLRGDSSILECSKGCHLCVCNFITTANSFIDHLVEFLAGSVPSMLTTSFLMTIDEVCHTEDNFLDLVMGRRTEVSNLDCHLLCYLVSGVGDGVHEGLSLIANLSRLNHLLFILVATNVCF